MHFFPHRKPRPHTYNLSLQVRGWSSFSDENCRARIGIVAGIIIRLRKNASERGFVADCAQVSANKLIIFSQQFRLPQTGKLKSRFAQRIHVLHLEPRLQSVSRTVTFHEAQMKAPSRAAATHNFLITCRQRRPRVCLITRHVGHLETKRCKITPFVRRSLLLLLFFGTTLKELPPTNTFCWLMMMIVVLVTPSGFCDGPQVC